MVCFTGVQIKCGRLATSEHIRRQVLQASVRPAGPLLIAIPREKLGANQLHRRLDYRLQRPICYSADVRFKRLREEASSVELVHAFRSSM